MKTKAEKVSKKALKDMLKVYEAALAVGMNEDGDVYVVCNEFLPVLATLALSEFAKTEGITREDLFEIIGDILDKEKEIFERDNEPFGIMAIGKPLELTDKQIERFMDGDYALVDEILGYEDVNYDELSPQEKKVYDEMSKDLDFGEFKIQRNKNGDFCAVSKESFVSSYGFGSDD
jgi:hypothetical protein